MKKICAAAAVSAVAFVANPASAQDYGPAGGFNVGVLVGIDSVTVDDGTDDGSEEDLLYGVTAGYDFYTDGGLMFGIEAELTDSSVEVSETDVFVAGDEISVGAGRDIYVGGRIGANLGSALVYAKGGYTNASLDADYDDGTTSLSDSEELEGFRIGAGAEFNVGTGFAIRAEYRYSDYGELNVDGVNTGVDVSRHQGVIAAIVKF